MFMKPYILLFWLSISLSFALSAQTTTGTIQFEEKINMHRNLPEDAGDMRAMIPEFRIMKSELLFTATESLYRNVEDDDDDDEVGGGGMVIKMQRPNAQFYKNLSAGQRIDQREFMGKQYLIEDAIEQTPWKVGSETREILGYACMQAVWEDTTADRKRTVVAWFAPDIPVAAGPVNYGELPGMILSVDINNGELELTAKSIDTKAPKKDELEAPAKGEKTTQDAFRTMMDERIKAMGGSNGRGMRVIRN
jgi:GLPGLI family protein